MADEAPVVVKVDTDGRRIPRLVQVGPHLIAIDYVTVVENLGTQTSRITTSTGAELDVDMPLAQVAKALEVDYVRPTA